MGYCRYTVFLSVVSQFGNNASTSCEIGNAQTCPHDKIAPVDNQNLPDERHRVHALYDVLLYVLVKVGTAAGLLYYVSYCRYALYPTG